MIRSKAALNRRGWAKRGWNAFFEYTGKNGQKQIGKGRKYNVDGIELELFPSSVLCAMLWRGLRALYAWEKNFNFPPAMWRVREDTHCVRWYSRKQLIAIRTIYEHYGRLAGKNRSRLPDFIGAVRIVFHTIDIPKEAHSVESG
jgi:hypothetical protein